ncbi:MAG: hypothetical protein HKN10_01740 [Myxococcales bacterium]|nr:hypothetical protein [Myxococcales bacterium]
MLKLRDEFRGTSSLCRVEREADTEEILLIATKAKMHVLAFPELLEIPGGRVNPKALWMDLVDGRVNVFVVFVFVALDGRCAPTGPLAAA